MSRVRMFSLALLAACAAGAPASAQSLFSTRGLGVPVAPLDARGIALGGIGVGLFGVNPGMVNPADLAGVRLRGVVASVQPGAQQVEFQGAEDEIGGTRFPLARILYPVGSRVVLGLGYGSFLDQSWAVASEGEVEVAGTRIATRDVFRSDGGIAQVRLSGSYALTEALALGVAAGIYTGGNTLSITRAFEDAELPGLLDFETTRRWSYTGPLASLGVNWTGGEALRAGASLTWSGSLDVDPEPLRGEISDAEGEPAEVDLPLQAAVGASAMLAPRLAATLGLTWAGWSSAADDLAPANPLNPQAEDAARDSWQVGGGLEWSGAQLRDRRLPVRLGARYARLPFPLAPESDAPTEWAVSLGLGARLAGDEAVPLATADATIERGRRSAEAGDAVGALAEAFWRLTVSIALFGR